MNRLMNFYIELHKIESETSIKDTPQQLEKRVCEVVERYFPYADNTFKHRAYCRCLQGVAYNENRRKLSECINAYSKLEFGGEICD